MMSTTDQNQKRFNQPFQTMLSRLDKILIIGLGQLGLPVAKYVKERGLFYTYGYDIEIKTMERAERTVGTKQVTDFSVEDFDVYVICVLTHKPDDIFSPQIDGLLSISQKISRARYVIVKLMTNTMIINGRWTRMV